MEKKKQHLPIRKAQQLEESVRFFTQPTPELIAQDFDLIATDGAIHARSEELIRAMRQLAEAREIIAEILASVE